VVKKLRSAKTIGRILIILCLPLLAVSLVGYLFSAHPYAGYISREYSRDVNISQGKSFYIWYNLSQSPIIINQSLSVSFEVRSEEVIDFYVMSNSQYEDWENGSSAAGILEERATNSQNLVFSPTEEGKYYLVLDNSPYNSSVSAQFQSTWTAALTLIDYNEAFSWLMISFLCVVLLITVNFLSGNPISFATRKILDSACLKKVKAIRKDEDIRTRSKLNSKLFWVTFGLLTSAVSIALLVSAIRNLSFVTQGFPELFSMFFDVHARLFLYCFASVAFYSIFSLFWMWLFGFLDDLNLWYFAKIKKFPWNPDLSVRSFRFFLRMIVSIRSIAYYLAGLTLFVVGYFLSEFRLALFVAAIFVFSIPISSSVFQSFRRACKALHLKWRTELRHEMPFTNNGIMIAIWMVPAFLLVARILSPAVLDIAEFFTIKSCPLARFQEYFYSELDPRASLSEGISVLTSDMLLYNSLFFLLIMIFSMYFLPTMSKRLAIRSRLKSLIIALIAAFLAFFTDEIYTSLIESAYRGRQELSLFIAAIAFGATYVSARAFEEAVK
jgi:hypothetical protein